MPQGRGNAALAHEAGQHTVGTERILSREGNGEGLS